ncbi:MAG: MoxR family ATPase [Polyangiaceae bacterium]|nr:MoxR family ATPase [Polyangiaceae bacterium]
MLTVLECREQLLGAGYFADDRTSLAVSLALELERPVLIEGPAGVGKTDLARAAAEALGRKMVRLQCYEGLDDAKALYEWNYTKQLLFAQVSAQAGSTAPAADLFSEAFLIPRPLLSVLVSEEPCVLLLDEVDRADPEFEALLLEILSEFQITIPEIGTFRAKHKPLVFLTTNGTRDLTDALRRRCLYLPLDYPTPARELEIVRAKLPTLHATLGQSLVDFMERVRSLELRQRPSIAETIDWAKALLLLNKNALDAPLVRATLGVILKHSDDIDRVDSKIDAILK